MYESKEESQLMSEDEEGSQLMSEDEEGLQLMSEDDKNKEQQLNLGMLSRYIIINYSLTKYH